MNKKRIRTRRIVLIAILTALSTAGRFIPVIKPVCAITIITGMYLGPLSGFLVGAMSALLSNFYFGQGPWTVFQMGAWGLIGLVSGLISKPLKESRIILLLFGALSGIVFSLIMDVWTVIWYMRSFDISYYLTAITAAIPYTLSYVISNMIFLYMLAKPIGEKIERIKIKYGV